MSRIGKVPVVIPSGVDITIDGQSVRVKGPKGDITQEFSPLAQITKNEDTVVVNQQTAHVLPRQIMVLSVL
jgi:large subunit ribosomal protein L6